MSAYGFNVAVAGRYGHGKVDQQEMRHGGHRGVFFGWAWDSWGVKLCPAPPLFG